MASRYTKSIPQYVYFTGEGEWIQGPFVHPKKGHKNRQFRLTEINDYGMTSVAVVCRDLADFHDWKITNFVIIRDIDTRRFESGDKTYYAVYGLNALISKQFDDMVVTYFAPTSKNYNEIIASISQCIKIKKSKK